MVDHRAQWKGFIKFGEVSCGVGLYTAASSSERISFHTINKRTGNRVNRIFIDIETDSPVEREDQTKGFEIEDGQYIMIDPEDVAATIPDSNKTLEIDAFISCADVDNVYFDKPYYLVPTDRVSSEAFTALRDAMSKSEVAALARTVLFKRMRTVLIRTHGKGLIATTMQYDYEVRSSQKAFEEIPKLRIKGEMLDLAKHIIATKKGSFDPAEFDDRYEAAVAELVTAKVEGKALPKRKEVKVSKPGDLLAALRDSAKMLDGGDKKTKRPATSATKAVGRKPKEPEAEKAGRRAASSQRKAG